MSKGKRTLGGLGLGMVVVALVLLGAGLGAAPAWAQLVCGGTIGPGGNFTLTGDLGPCPGPDPALTVVGPVKFNLNGFTVSCDNTMTDGIVVEGTRAVVLNGTVTGCEDGVQLDGDGRHLITGIVSRNNGNDGFEINSNWNKLAFNLALGNGDEGYQIDGSFNHLSFNKARGNGSDNGSDGFAIADVAHDNTLISNWAEGNVDAGYEVRGDGNVLKLNVAKGNDRGFVIGVDGTNNLLHGNTALANNEDGFDVDGDDNVLTHNVAKRNGEDGIDVETDATGNRLQHNIAFNNNQNGLPDTFDLEDDNPDCDANTWVDNTFGTASQPCIN